MTPQVPITPPASGHLLPLPPARSAGERLVRATNRLGGRALRALDGYFVKHSRVGHSAFFDPADFPWAATLESHWLEMRSELDALLERRDELPSFQDISPHQAILTDDDRWKTFFFYGYGRKPGRNVERCPQTAGLLQHVPGLTTAMFSILAPGKRIPPHEGPYRGVLRYHLGLRVPPGGRDCAIRVAGETRQWQEGRSLIFDDVFQHEVWNETPHTRAILFVDFKRPLDGSARLVNEVLLGLIRVSPFVKDAAARQRAWDARFEHARQADRASARKRGPA